MEIPRIPRFACRFFVNAVLFSVRTAGSRKRLGRNPGKTYYRRNFFVGKLVMVWIFCFEGKYADFTMISPNYGDFHKDWYFSVL